MLIFLFEGIVKKPIKEDINFNSLEYMYQEIDKAKKEWEYALKRFNDVNDPEVIDYIIFYIIAAERRYMYLLNKFKNMDKKIVIDTKEKKYEK